MQPIALMILEDDVRTELSTIIDAGKIIEVHPSVGVAQLKSRLTKSGAFAIIGAGPKKADFAREALLLRKHVLSDFPAGLTWSEVARLKQISASKGVLFYSPNLLRFEAGINELSQMVDRGASKLLSVTISCDLAGRGEQTQLLMKFAQIIDMIEWLVGSKCVDVRQEKSHRVGSATARVVLMSHQNDVKTLLNLRCGASRNSSLWIDCIFNDSIVHVDPKSQSVRLVSSSNASHSEVNWTVQPLSKAIGAFKMMMRHGSGESDFNSQRRLIQLTRELV